MITVHSTCPIESVIGICRGHSANVKNRRDGQMALRWCAAGMNEAAKRLRKVNGHLHLGKLRASLQRHVAAQNHVYLRQQDRCLTRGTVTQVS